ncbi:MAG: ATP-binding protein, partial [Alphaproteobacteria bacterium]
VFYKDQTVASGFRQARDKKFITDIAKRLKSFEGANSQIIRLASRGERDTARALFTTTWRPRHRTLLASLDRLLNHKTAEIKRITNMARSETWTSRMVIAMLAGLGVLLSFALALGITFSLTRPIGTLVEATERVAAGDLTSKAEIDSQDEIGLLARRFNEMLERLNNSISEQKRFYADASHELRTPLTVIRGEAEVALRGPESGTDHRETLQTIIVVANQMGNLVDELLFLARAEAGEVQYEMAEVDLKPVLEEVGNMGESLASLKDVGFDMDLAHRAMVRGDPQRLRQLFFILMDNAVKYSDEGGQVTLALANEDNLARVTVADNGIGIPASDMPYIFERFSRGERARATRTEGTGLGLSIAKSITEAHDGKILVDSKDGRGTKISLVFPLITGRV